MSLFRFLNYNYNLILVYPHKAEEYGEYNTERLKLSKLLLFFHDWLLYTLKCLFI